jgi:ribosomal protein S18 acetylase RimI-like enzyme
MQPIRKSLANAVVELDEMRSDEVEEVRALLNGAIAEGQSYPQSQPLNEAGFAAYWMNRDAFVVRVVDGTETLAPGKILGAFYIKPNFPGRGSHICNAGFIVQPSARGQGLGRWMGESMLAIAREKGYEAVMFNFVFANNTASLNLWKSLGFSIIGIIPNGVKLDDGVVDGVVMYRGL